MKQNHSNALLQAEKDLIVEEYRCAIFKKNRYSDLMNRLSAWMILSNCAFYSYLLANYEKISLRIIEIGAFILIIYNIYGLIYSIHFSREKKRAENYIIKQFENSLDGLNYEGSRRYRRVDGHITLTEIIIFTILSFSIVFMKFVIPLLNLKIGT